jgi:hypothetical protein
MYYSYYAIVLPAILHKRKGNTMLAALLSAETKGGT